MIIDAVQYAGSYVDGTRILKRIKLELSDKYREKYYQMLALNLRLYRETCPCCGTIELFIIEHAEYGRFLGVESCNSEIKDALNYLFENFNPLIAVDWLDKNEKLN